MAYFDKLTLSGIRSFGPNEEDKGVIKFSSPLTLILGENGCGKTTIIEALKFACCGELPPDTEKGSGFIYDPKLTPFTETKAQINLKLKDINGQVMSVLRLMTCTQKLKKAEFKRVDQTINRQDRNGKWISLSHKCADVDTEMSIALGVSKAILSNVILCHQEDSNWPLQGDAKVKEKFDAIFGAVKYNKCLAHVRDLRKSLLDDLRIMKTDMYHLKEYKKEAGDKRAKITDAEHRLEKHQDEISTLKMKLVPIQRRMSELSELEDKISRLHTERETEKARLEAVKNAMNEFRRNITIEFKGTMDELKITIQNFAEELRKKEENIDQLEKEGEDVSAEIDRNLQIIGNEKVKIGQLLRDFENYKERIDTRNSTLLRICDEIDINTSFSELSQGKEVDRVLSLLDDEIAKRLDDFKSLQDKQNSDIQKIQVDIDNCRAARAKLEQSLENKQSTIKQNKEELQKIKSDIYDVDQSTQRLNQLETKMERVKHELDLIIKSNELEKLENEMKSANSERNRCEEELSVLDREVQVLQLLSSEQAKLDVLRKAKNSADAEISKLKSRHGSTLKHLFGEVSDVGIKLQLDAIIDKLADQIKQMKKEIKMKENEIIGYGAEKKHLVDKLKELKQSFETDEFTISKACDGKDFDESLKEVTSSVDELQVEKGTLSASQFMSRRYIQTLQQKSPSCPLCHRGFSKEDEVTQLIQELTLKVKEVPSRLRANKDSLDTMEKKKENLLQLKPKYEKLSVIKCSEIPSLQSEINKLEKKLSVAKESLLKLQNDLEQPETDESLAKGIQSDIVLLEQHLAESRRITREIQKLEANMPPGNKRSLEEALKEQKELRENVLHARRSFEEKQTQKNKLIEKRNKLQEEKNAIQNQQLKISGNAQMRNQLVERRDELESLEVVLQMEVDKGTEDLEDLCRKLDLLMRQKKSTETSNAKALEEERQKVRNLENQYEDVKKQQKRISEYESLGGNKRLEAAQQNLATLESKGDTLQMKKMSLNDQRETLKNYVTAQCARQRELDDNLKLRQKEVEEKNLIEKISALNSRLGNLDCSKLNVERKTLKEEEDKLYSEVAFVEGRLRELKNSMKSIQDDLNKDIYRNADRNYRDKLIDIEVAEQTAEDLNKYYIAFDNALISYHQDRMQHINKVIHELWRRIYTGNDIDTIQIKTEQEGATSADKRKVYNYRVVQIKNSTELDMKGRCSAGQKVLASLIIRMALAETFSSKCGVLALDEPTTNLDQRNIHNLSSALEELVNTHSGRRNFQLIVITHDQEFLDVLTKSEKIDYYFKLSRNGEGKSVVTKIDIST